MVAELGVPDPAIRVAVVVHQKLHLLWLQVQHLVTADGQSTGKLNRALKKGWLLKGQTSKNAHFTLDHPFHSFFGVVNWHLALQYTRYSLSSTLVSVEL